MSDADWNSAEKSYLNHIFIKEQSHLTANAARMAFTVHSLLEVLPSSDDKVIDYTYISDDNFLLVLLLTAKGE